MTRKCRVCKKNGNQALFGCGYIPEEERNPNAQYLFSLYQDPSFLVKECPVWYYNKNTWIYKLWNLMKNSSMDLTRESFYRRMVYLTFKNHLALREEAELKKLRRQNG